MDRVSAYNQRSSAYNMCGANEDDVVEPQRTRRSRRPRDYDDISYEDDDSQSTAPSRGDRGSFDDAPRRSRRKQREEWPVQDELAPPPSHERRAVKAIAYSRQDEKSPGPAATPSSKGSTFGRLFTPKKPKESFRTKTLTELTETGTSSVARVKEGNVKFPNSWSGHRVTVFNPYHPRRAISASRGAAAPSRHRCASSPGEKVEGGFFFDFGAIRTASSDRDAPAQVSCGTRRC